MEGMAKFVRIPSPKQILAIRTGLGMTQTEAGAKVGVSQRQWLAWEKGTAKPSKSAALLIDLLKNGKL